VLLGLEDQTGEIGKKSMALDLADFDEATVFG